MKILDNLPCKSANAPRNDQELVNVIVVQRVFGIGHPQPVLEVFEQNAIIILGAFSSVILVILVQNIGDRSLEKVQFMVRKAGFLESILLPGSSIRCEFHPDQLPESWHVDRRPMRRKMRHPCPSSFAHFPLQTTK